VIRYLFEYLGIPYEEKRYQSEKEWFETDKYNIGLDFPSNKKKSDDFRIYIYNSFSLSYSTNEQWFLFSQVKKNKISTDATPMIDFVFSNFSFFKKKKRSTLFNRRRLEDY